MFSEKSFRYQPVFQKLPPPITITDSQIQSSYHLFYDKLLESYKKEDFVQIIKLLISTSSASIIVNFKYPVYEEESTNDSLLKDLATLLYTIITIYPVKYYKAQLLAASFLNHLFTSNKKIAGLKFDWKPYHKVMNYYMTNQEAKFISGSLFTQAKKDLKSGMYISLSLTNKLTQLLPKLLKYFASDDMTKQLVKKFIPHISTNDVSSLLNFTNFIPLVKGEYKQFLDYFLFLLKDPKPFKNDSILIAINEIVKTNIEDDFSCLFPFLFHLTSERILNHFTISFISLPSLLVSLFISPPTRQGILELFESFFISFKSSCHPSVSRKGVSDLFILIVVLNLRKALKKLGKTNQLYYNMDKKMGPSKEDIHKLLSMTSEINIMNIRHCFNSDIFLIETNLDPLLIDRYFDIAFQCIELTDAFNVASSGWNILTTLMMSIDKNEKIRNSFESLFQIATNNLYRIELTQLISAFLAVSLLKVPFNRKNTLKGLENTNFCKLANSYFSNLIQILRFQPSAKDETAQINNYFNSFVNRCIKELFRNCETEIFDELLPLITSLAYDDDVIHCVFQVELIVSNFCYYANKEQAMKVSQAFLSRFESSGSNLNNFRYFSSIISICSTSNLLTKESVKQSVDLILPFTKNKNEKIRCISWNSIGSALFILSDITNVKISLKPDKMIGYPLENANLNDFDIDIKFNQDISDLTFEVLNPVYDKILEIKDQYELKTYFDEVFWSILNAYKSTHLITDGSKDEINEVYLNSISFVPELIKKSVPIKDKLIKCLIRIFQDFPENEPLISKVSLMTIKIFNNASNSTFNLVSKYFMSFDTSTKIYNSGLLHYALIDTEYKRSQFFIQPLTDDIKKLFKLIIQLTVSDSKNIRENCFSCFNVLMPNYSNFIVPCLLKIVENQESIPPKNFISFVVLMSKYDYLFTDDKIFCQIIMYILKNFESNEKEKEFLDNLKLFLRRITTDSPFKITSEDSLEFLNVLNEIEKNYINRIKPNRSFVCTVLDIIIVCLKHVKNISDNIIYFIINSIVHYDQEISHKAEICLFNLLERKSKYTKEKIYIKQYPTISSIPNIFDKITVKFPRNGFYFPSNIKPTKINEIFGQEEEVEKNNENDHINESISSEYSIDISPTTSIEVNLENTNVNEEIIQVFDSFKEIEIECNLSEEEKLLFDSEFLNDNGNGFFMFKDHYNHKQYEFTENKTLTKYIPDIFASAFNAINEKNLKSNVNYSNIWKYYALTVGPFCIRKLSKISRKYLSEYFEKVPEITSKILKDMIDGFLSRIFYWKFEDRIKFFKLVVLPIISIISTNPHLNNLFQQVVSNAAFTNLFCLAPLIKVIFELSEKGTKLTHFNSCFLNNIVHTMISRQIFFFNTIDQLKAKFINPFIEKMSEYKMNEIADISFLFFRLFDCCSFITKKSPMYSSEIESKTIETLSIFDTILHKENTNDCLIYFLVNSFRFFSSSSFRTRLLIAPIFIKNLHIIFQLLKSTRISTEESFIISFRKFIENDIFFSDRKMEFDFISTFIGEMKNAPLPLQQILLENLNKMLETNIFYISKSDYDKFENIIVDYGIYENSLNFGNELRLKIAKILGIFELRKCSLKKSDINFEKVEDGKLIDELILKAASIILNTYLFDRVDEKVTDLLVILERLCNIEIKNKAKNKAFFKNVLEIFIKRHTGHVINEVEDILIQYKYMMTPSYIC